MNAHAFGMPQGKPITLQTLARQMLDEAGGDINKAAVRMDNYAAGVQRFNDELRMLGIRTALSAAIQSQRATVLRDYRMPAATASALHRMSAADKVAQARLKMSGAIVRSALMEMEFQIGNVAKRLREWTGIEILAHGETQLATARSSARNAQFLISVGRMAGAKKIGDLGDATVERLHKEAMESGE